MNVERAAPGLPPAVRRRRGRLVLLGLAALFGLPIALAWMLSTGALRLAPERTVNHGTLLAPRVEVDPAGLAPLDGHPLPAGLLRAGWTLLYLGDPGCAEPCRRALRVMRQVRLAQGREMDRVRRLLVVTEGLPMRERLTLLGEHPGLRIAAAPPAWAASLARRLEAATPPAGAPSGPSVLLVDPRGGGVLRFGLEADPRGLSKDLERLLRAAPPGGAPE